MIGMEEIWMQNKEKMALIVTFIFIHQEKHIKKYFFGEVSL
jgi:hypothetical protein